MLKGVNHTVLTLIPKVKDVQTMKDLRPISLCNMLYKVISKILTSRLQPYMNSIIGDEQSAFIRGKLISDNILLNHDLKQKRYGKNFNMPLKLDVNKAYDCVQWSYLHHVLTCLGFHVTWITIMDCVTSVTYSVQINGHRSSFFAPSRGLH